MKVKELLEFLSFEEDTKELFFRCGLGGRQRSVSHIRLTISDVTLVRDETSVFNHTPIKLSEIKDRLKSQDHKDLYFESYLDLVGKTKIKSLESLKVS